MQALKKSIKDPVLQNYLRHSETLNRSLKLLDDDFIGRTPSERFKRVEELTHRSTVDKNGVFTDGFFDMRNVDFSPRYIIFCVGLDDPEYKAWEKQQRLKK